MSNYTHSTLYVGVTNNILKRVYQHKIKDNPQSFTAKYNINKLVYYESYYHVNDAISREKQIKSFPRMKKNHLVNKMNPCWIDLAEDWYGKIVFP